MQLAIENELDSHRAFETRPTAGDLASLPATPAVYALLNPANQVVLLATTQDLRRVLQSRLFDPADAEAGKRADLAEITRGVRWRNVSNAFEAKWRYWRLARELHPKDYRERIGFGPAYFLHVDWARPIPEIRVTERIWTISGEFVGPFQSGKTALTALESLWDIFDLCRYPEQVRRAPRGVRCSYADMGRCDAPCDGSVPLPAYLERMRSAWNFAGNTARSEQFAFIEESMRDAAAAQRFEIAAQWKKRFDAAKAWAQSSIGLYRDEELQFAIALPVTRRSAWKFLHFDRGRLLDGPVIPKRALESALHEWVNSLDVGELLEIGDTECMEQAWLLSQMISIDTRERNMALNLARTPRDQWTAALLDRIRASASESEPPNDR